MSHPKPALQYSALHRSLVPDTYINFLSTSCILLCCFHPFWSFTEMRRGKETWEPGQRGFRGWPCLMNKLFNFPKPLWFHCFRLKREIYLFSSRSNGDIWLRDLQRSGHSVNAGCCNDDQRFHNGRCVHLMLTHYHQKATSPRILISPKTTLTLNFTGD